MSSGKLKNDIYLADALLKCLPFLLNRRSQLKNLSNPVDFWWIQWYNITYKRAIKHDLLLNI